MIECNSCDASVPKGSKFCPSCGNRLDHEMPATCSKCGQYVNQGQKLCESCGAPVAPIAAVGGSVQNDSVDGPTQTVDDDARVGFSLSKPTNGWPVGQYKAVVFLNGKEVGNMGFSVQP